jgi:CSLREA domain-containing protein
MAARKRRFAVGAIALSVFFLALSGLARATAYTVDTTADTSGAGDCSLRDAINAANGSPTGGSTCTTAGTGTDTIGFSVTGTISLGSTLPTITDTGLTITGPAGSPGITIDGGSSVQVMAVTGTATLQTLTVAHGSSATTGGGIFNSGTLTLTNCTFSANSAATLGGGIDNSGGTMTVADSTFVNNSAGADGGAIFNDSNSTLTVTNSTFSANTSVDFGGGIFNGHNAILKITNSTFSANSTSASDGGGVENFLGTAILKSTILAAEPSGGNCAGSGTPPVTDAGFNISDDGSCGFGATSVNNSATLHLDPAGLQNNGGPTNTIALEPNSQAVDFIPIADCTDQSSPTPLPVTSDQRGLPRPDPGNPFFCDAGAYELQTSGSFILDSEKIQVARSTTASNADQVNMGLTFTDTPNPTCDAADDVLHNGITVELFGGSCSDLMGSGLTLDLNPFVVHTVGGHSYGSISQSSPPESVLARIVTLVTPEGDCGKWSLNVEVGGLDTTALGLTDNPFALILVDSDMRGFGCFDISDAIVGNQLDPPHKVRRGARRGRR